MSRGFQIWCTVYSIPHPFILLLYVYSTPTHPPLCVQQPPPSMCTVLPLSQVCEYSPPPPPPPVCVYSPHHPPVCVCTVPPPPPQCVCVQSPPTPVCVCTVPTTPPQVCSTLPTSVCVQYTPPKVCVYIAPQTCVYTVLPPPPPLPSVCVQYYLPHKCVCTILLPTNVCVRYSLPVCTYLPTTRDLDGLGCVKVVPVDLGHANKGQHPAEKSKWTQSMRYKSVSTTYSKSGHRA